MNVEYATYHGLAPKTDYYNNIPWASAKRSDLSRLATYIHILKIWWIQSSTFWDNIGLQEKEKKKEKTSAQHAAFQHVSDRPGGLKRI